MKKRDEYVLKMQESLDSLNAMLKEFESSAEMKATEAQHKFLQEKHHLTKQAHLIGERLNEMKRATETSWEHMIESTEIMHHALISSLHYFKGQLKAHQAEKDSDREKEI